MSTSGPASMSVPTNSEACGTQSRCIVERPGTDCSVPSSSTRGASSSAQRAMKRCSRSELGSPSDRGAPANTIPRRRRSKAWRHRPSSAGAGTEARPAS